MNGLAYLRKNGHGLSSSHDTCPLQPSIVQATDRRVCCVPLTEELHREFSSSVFLNFSLYYEVYVLRLIL